MNSRHVEGSCIGDQGGAVRRVAMPGRTIRQNLLAPSGLGRSCTDAFREPAPVSNYVATIRVTPVLEAGQAFVDWRATVDSPPEEQARWVEQFEQKGFTVWRWRCAILWPVTGSLSASLARHRRHATDQFTPRVDPSIRTMVRVDRSICIRGTSASNAGCLPRSGQERLPAVLSGLQARSGGWDGQPGSAGFRIAGRQHAGQSASRPFIAEPGDRP